MSDLLASFTAAAGDDRSIRAFCSRFVLAPPVWSERVAQEWITFAQTMRSGAAIEVIEGKVGPLAGVAVCRFSGRGPATLLPVYAVRQGSEWRLLARPTRRACSWYGLAGPVDNELREHEVWAQEYSRVQQAEAAKLTASITVARWSLGEATKKGQALRPGAMIGLGEVVQTGTKKPGRLLLSNLPKSSLVLAPATSLSISEEAAGGGKDLVIDLAEGVVQCDIGGLAGYRRVRVRAGVSDTVVTGTIFVVQRLAGKQDYVALVEGKVAVIPKDKRLGAGTAVEGEIELRSRQGVSFTEAGAGQIDQLLNRPNLDGAILAGFDIRTQALASADSMTAIGAGSGEASWTSTSTSELSGDTGVGGTEQIAMGIQELAPPSSTDFGQAIGDTSINAGSGNLAGDLPPSEEGTVALPQNPQEPVTPPGVPLQGQPGFPP